MPIWFDWPRIEADAIELTSYQLSVIAGIAQSPAYAKAVLHGREDSVDARLKRQEILDKEDPPLLSLLVDEQSLHRSGPRRRCASSWVTCWP